MSFYSQINDREFETDQYVKASIQELKEIAERDLASADAVAEDGDSGYEFDDVYSELVNRICRSVNPVLFTDVYDNGMSVSLSSCGTEFEVTPNDPKYGSYQGGEFGVGKSVYEAINDAEKYIAETKLEV